jgi:hypothetical protein
MSASSWQAILVAQSWVMHRTFMTQCSELEGGRARSSDIRPRPSTGGHDPMNTERDHQTACAEHRANDRPMKRERRARRAAWALTGLLGVTWAVVIASRYPSLVTS